MHWNQYNPELSPVAVFFKSANLSLMYTNWSSSNKGFYSFQILFIVFLLVPP
jgi:hypothetical protein